MSGEGTVSDSETRSEGRALFMRYPNKDGGEWKRAHRREDHWRYILDDNDDKCQSQTKKRRASADIHEGKREISLGVHQLLLSHLSGEGSMVRCLRQSSST